MRANLKALLGTLVATTVIVAASAATAQAPAWAVGTWKGKLDGFRNDPGGAERVMVVEPSGQCRWDYAAKAAGAMAAKSCSFTGDSVDLLTAASSTVKLKHSDGKLRGHFAASGKTFTITMSK